MKLFIANTAHELSQQEHNQLLTLYGQVSAGRKLSVKESIPRTEDHDK